MKLEEAHRILDEQKDGTRIHPNHVVRTALRATGDIARALPTHTQPFSEASINEWMESTRMVSGEGIGTAPIGNIQGNQSGIDQNNEGNQ
jgi:hypothetical protein